MSRTRGAGTRVARRRTVARLAGAGLAMTVVACAPSAPPEPPEPASALGMRSPASEPASPEAAVPSTAPALSPAAPTPTAASPTVTTPAPAPPPDLVGDDRNAWAFAPVEAPEDLVVEGSVRRQRAWSTSKVLIAATFIDAVAGGDPGRLTEDQRSWVERAMGESDMDSLTAMRRAIPGDRTARMQEILRSAGDQRTVVPDSKHGTMEWRIEDQIGFMAALARGEVVSPATSEFLLGAMQPVESQRWGLPAVGATATKGGWLTPDTETRQMGILDGYAVALVTDAVGPAVLQSDGDSAHVERMDELAALLKERLTAERADR